jgi:hypothetical protein
VVKGQLVPQKYWNPPTILHVVTNQKTAIVMTKIYKVKCLITHATLELYGGVEVLIFTFLTSALYEWEW